MPLTRIRLLFALGVATGLALTSCGAPSALSVTPSVTAIGHPTPTAFQPATSTPSVLRVWISPAVPDPIRHRLELLAAESAGNLTFATDSESADVRLEPGGEVPLTSWIYAVVAPFPMIEDELTSEQLHAAWLQGAVWLAPETAAAMETLLGPPAVSPIIVPAEELLERAWAERPSLAIVPFEDLEPRWKVMALDGASPIHRNFDTAEYPLRLEFGLTGDGWAVGALRQRLTDMPASNRDPNRLTVVVMTGVTALTRATAARMETEGVMYPSALIGDWLRQADVTHVSNEVSFTPNCPVPRLASRGLRFCSLPSHFALLEDIGVDVVEMTGNHVLDWGPDPFLYTLDLYRAHGWLTFGGGENMEQAQQPALLEHHGNRLAFLGCNPAGPDTAWATETRPGAAPCDFERLAAEIARLRGEGILPIVTFQWWESCRVSPDRRQLEDFRSAVDAGAVIVSGSQAHSPMSFEFYQGAFIHYGLGNLFFDQMDALATRQELIDRHVFYDGRYISTDVLTALLENYAQPRPMTPDERAALLSALFSASGW
ncbi:MAG: CapA family protein [Chloroflexota bacterium]